MQCYRSSLGATQLGQTRAPEDDIRARLPWDKRAEGPSGVTFPRVGGSRGRPSDGEIRKHLTALNAYAPGPKLFAIGTAFKRGTWAFRDLKGEVQSGIPGGDFTLQIISVGNIVEVSVPESEWTPIERERIEAQRLRNKKNPKNAAQRGTVYTPERVRRFSVSIIHGPDAGKLKMIPEGELKNGAWNILQDKTVVELIGLGVYFQVFELPFLAGPTFGFYDHILAIENAKKAMEDAIQTGKEGNAAMAIQFLNQATQFVGRALDRVNIIQDAGWYKPALGNKIKSSLNRLAGEIGEIRQDMVGSDFWTKQVKKAWNDNPWAGQIGALINDAFTIYEEGLDFAQSIVTQVNNFWNNFVNIKKYSSATVALLEDIKKDLRRKGVPIPPSIDWQIKEANILRGASNSFFEIVFGKLAAQGISPEEVKEAMRGKQVDGLGVEPVTTTAAAALFALFGKIILALIAAAGMIAAFVVWPEISKAMEENAAARAEVYKEKRGREVHVFDTAAADVGTMTRELAKKGLIDPRKAEETRKVWEYALHEFTRYLKNEKGTVTAEEKTAINQKVTANVLQHIKDEGYYTGSKLEALVAGAKDVKGTPPKPPSRRPGAKKDETSALVYLVPLLAIVGGSIYFGGN